MEDEGAEGVDWDGLPLEILEIFFCHLPVNDLLSCSVMSKNWKKAARDVLKRNRECYAHIKDFHRDIQALNEMIATTSLMEMANGLHIRDEIKPNAESGSASSQKSRRSSHYKKSPKKSERTLEEAKQRIREVLRVQWRYLNLDMGQPWKPALSQCDSSLLREVIFATSGSLEKLMIGRDCDWNLIPCKSNEYSKLKIIELLHNHYLDGMQPEIFSPKFAPKLEEISGEMMELEACRPPDCFTMKRMKSIMLHSDLEVPEGKSKEEAFGYVSGLHRLYLRRCHCDPYEEAPEHEQDLLAWQDFVFPFVLRSLDTLEELHMYTVDFCNLFETSQALQFPNLRRLSLATNSRTFIEIEIPNLKQLNLPKLCPNLEKVECSGDDSWIEIQMQLMRPFDACSGPDHSSKPLQIEFDCRNGFSDMHVCQYLKFFNAVYSNITQVRILNWNSIFDMELGSVIWEMNSLESLGINIDRLGKFSLDEWSWVLDALLCGINVEEAKLLFQGRRKKNANLSAVIVPIGPSLFNLKSLKELKLTEDMIGCGKIVKYSQVIHITENLPVRQVRKLKVTFKGREEFCNDMKQLRAFSGLSSAYDPET